MHKILERLADKSNRHSRLAIISFAVLLLASPILGYWTYNRQMNAQEQDVKASLSRVASIRADMISSFIRERSGDAQILVGSPFVAAAIRAWQKQGYRDGDIQAELRQRLTELKRVYGYTEAAITDRSGNALISSETVMRPFDDVAVKLIASAAVSGKIQISSIAPLGSSVKSERIINVAAQFFLDQTSNENGKLILLLRFDPAAQLYPALQEAPLPNLPNDTLLVETQGQQVVSLSDARFAPYHYLESLPITAAQLYESATTSKSSLSWQTADGKMEIGAAHAIEGAPWFIVTMVAEHAINDIVRNTVRIAAIVSAAMLCVFGVGILLWWKYKESEYKLVSLQTETRERFLQQKYDYLSKYANDMIILADADFNIIEMNDKAVQAIGYPVLALTGQPIVTLSAPSGHNQLIESLHILHSNGTAIFETCFQRRDGTMLPSEVSARAIDVGGQFFNQFICRDITERKEAEQKIQFLAYYDNVTSLPNRTLLSDRLDQAIHMAIRSSKKVGVLFMDLDNFKNINDSLGHQIGDMLLHAVGQRLLDCVREEDTVARIGGDEFMVLLPDLDRNEEARIVAEKIITTFAKPFQLQSHQIYITTSIGISLFPDDSRKVQDLIKYADSALYEAKNRGRNVYQFFTQALNEQIIRSSKIERRLRDAMETDDLCLWYQPQIDIKSGVVIGAEGLLRWRNGKQDASMPANYITVAEERGLITKLGEWTIREACRQCNLWQSKGLQAVPVAVNVSPIQMQQKGFAELVLAILRDSGLDASLLELEITETSIMQSAKIVADLTMKLRHSGVRISIDDFGTGYSSLSFLKHIPIDKIKIDRSFVLDMLSDTEDETITQAIIMLGRSLQLRVIAEGVESQAQMEKLLSLGCREAQGYFYSRAVSPDQFQGFLEKDWHFSSAEQIVSV